MKVLPPVRETCRIETPSSPPNILYLPLTDLGYRGEPKTFSDVTSPYRDYGSPSVLSVMKDPVVFPSYSKKLLPISSLKSSRSLCFLECSVCHRHNTCVITTYDLKVRRASKHCGLHLTFVPSSS